jgi:hypothetical protein
MRKLMCLTALVLWAFGTSRGDRVVVAANATPKCRAIDAKFTSMVTTVGCTSPIGLCASGTITHDPLIAGSHYATIVDRAPSAGMPASEPAGMLSLSGFRDLTPNRGGTLSTHITTVFDTAVPEAYFDELNVITGGTGPFAGATGVLHLFGQSPSPNSFAGGVRGTVCLPDDVDDGANDHDDQ